MDNKKDWEEIEKYNMERIQNEKEKSKFYFEEFKRNKKLDIFSKGLNITGWIFRIIIYIIILIFVITGIELLSARISNFNSRFSIRCFENTKAEYNILKETDIKV